MANFCTACGTELKGNMKFCSHCGEKIEGNDVNQINENQDIREVSNVETDTRVASNVETDTSVASSVETDTREASNVETGTREAKAKDKGKPVKKKKGCLVKFLIGIVILVVVFIIFIIALLLLPNKVDDMEDQIQVVSREYEDSEIFLIERVEEPVEIQTESDVKVIIPPYILDADTELEVAMVKDHSVIDELVMAGEGSVLEVFELNLGQEEAFNGFVEVRVPIQDGWFSGEENAVSQLMVYTFDEMTNTLIPEMIDIEGDEAVFYVNHFSSKVLVKEKEGSLKAAVRKSSMFSVSKEDVETILNEMNSGADKEISMLKLGLQAVEAGTGWAGNVATFTQLMEHTPSMKSTYTGLSTLGNTLFYIKCAEAINDGVMSGSYDKLGQVIVNDGLGYLIGSFAAAPVQVAYTAGMLVKYVGDTTMAYAKGIHDKKFEAVLPDLVGFYMKQKASENIVMGRQGDALDYKRKLIDHLLESARTASKPEDFNRTVQSLIQGMTDQIFSQELYLDKFDELVQDYGATNQNNSIIDYIANRDYERVPDNVKEQVSALVSKELEPVLKHVSYLLLEESKQAYYRSYVKILDDIDKEVEISFVLQGDMPENIPEMVLEFYDEQKGETLYDFAVTGKETIQKMNFEKYHELGLPKTVRLVIIGQESLKIFKQDYQFKLEDHEIVFIIGDILVMEDTTNDDDVVVDDLEDQGGATDLDNQGDASANGQGDNGADTSPEEKTSSGDETSDTGSGTAVSDLDLNGQWSVSLFFPKENIDWQSMAAYQGVDIGDMEQMDINEDWLINIALENGVYRVVEDPFAVITLSGNHLKAVFTTEDIIIFEIEGDFDAAGQSLNGNVKIKAFGSSYGSGSVTMIKK